MTDKNDDTDKIIVIDWLDNEIIIRVIENQERSRNERNSSITMEINGYQTSNVLFSE